MDIGEILFREIIVERNLRNFYYIGMGVISIIALVLARKTRFVRFSMLLWLFSGMICFLWEFTLFVTGSRSYNFHGIVELIYHALTEAGPGLIIMVITAHYTGLIDISRFRDGGGE